MAKPLQLGVMISGGGSTMVNLAKRIGDLKKDSGNRVVDSTRESEILRRLTARNSGPLNPNVLHHIFIDIIAAARAIQASQRVAYLGPEATFTHLAATSHFGYSVTYVPQPSIREIFSEVEKGACDYGVVPVENSVEGSVRHTLDLFFESDLCICAERYQQVSYDLLSQQISLSAVKTVYAHSQALNQCRNWLNQYLAGADLKECFEGQNSLLLGDFGYCRMNRMNEIRSDLPDKQAYCGCPKILEVFMNVIGLLTREHERRLRALLCVHLSSTQVSVKN